MAAWPGPGDDTDEEIWLCRIEYLGGRKRRGMTQEQVAVRMGVSVARVSQIESGDVSTQDALSRFVAALGGTLKLVADFRDEQLKLA
jgi:transcriptional regulator with XRE-family HTH domain